MGTLLGPSASARLWAPIALVPRSAAGRKTGAEVESFRAVPPAMRVTEGVKKQKLVARGGGPTNPSSEMARLSGPSHNKVESLARSWLNWPCLPLDSNCS